MSARACTFGSLLRATVQTCGLDYTRLSSELAESFASWLEGRVEQAWILAQWPGTMPIEERAFRRRFSLADIYAIGTEVYDAATLTYYRAKLDSFNGEPVGDNAYWESFAPADRTIVLDEFAETPIAEVLHIWRQDPRKFSQTQELRFWLTDEVAIVDRCASPTVWVQFRRRMPKFTAVEYDAAVTYSPEDVVYRAGTGDCYLCKVQALALLPESNPSHWAVQRVPDSLARYAQKGARADWLADDGQEDKSLAALGQANVWLNDRLADLAIHQQQAASYSVS